MNEFLKGRREYRAKEKANEEIQCKVKETYNGKDKQKPETLPLFLTRVTPSPISSKRVKFGVRLTKRMTFANFFPEEELNLKRICSDLGLKAKGDYSVIFEYKNELERCKLACEHIKKAKRSELEKKKKQLEQKKEELLRVLNCSSTQKKETWSINILDKRDQAKTKEKTIQSVKVNLSPTSLKSFGFEQFFFEWKNFEEVLKAVDRISERLFENPYGPGVLLNWSQSLNSKNVMPLRKVQVFLAAIKLYEKAAENNSLNINFKK